MIGEARLGGVGRFCRRYADLIGRKRAGDGRRGDFMLARHRTNGFVDLRIGERQHTIAQRLVNRRQAIKAQERG